MPLQGIVIWNDKDYRRTQTWSITCERLLSRCVDDGTVFELRQGEVALLVAVRRLPHFNLVEEVLNGKGGKFVLRMNSETSVWYVEIFVGRRNDGDRHLEYGYFCWCSVFLWSRWDTARSFHIVLARPLLLSFFGPRVCHTVNHLLPLLLIFNFPDALFRVETLCPF